MAQTFMDVGREENYFQKCGRPGEGGQQIRTLADEGGVGGQKWQKFADVLYGWPLMTMLHT